MTFKQFVAFATVVRYMNVTKAANDLGVSQPTLSKHLRSLERRFELKLIERRGNSIELTESGAQFHRELQPILAGLESLDQKYLKVQSGKRNAPKILRVYGTYGPSAEILPRLLALYEKANPTVQIELGIGNPTNIVAKLEKNHIDVAVVVSSRMYDSVAVEPFVWLKLAAFVSVHDRVARKSSLDLADLETVPLVVRGRRRGHGSVEMLFGSVIAAGYKPKTVMRCESPEALMAAVRNRIGVGFLFDDSVKHAIESGEFKRLHIRGLDMLRQSFILTGKDRTQPPHVGEFLTLIRQWRDKMRIAAGVPAQL